MHRARWPAALTFTAVARSCLTDTKHLHLVVFRQFSMLRCELLGTGKLTLVADLGFFEVETDRALANQLPKEQAALYECLLCRGQDISAYLVDGDFSFASTPKTAPPANDQVQLHHWSGSLRYSFYYKHGPAMLVRLALECNWQAVARHSRAPSSLWHPFIQTLLHNLPAINAELRLSVYRASPRTLRRQ